MTDPKFYTNCGADLEGVPPADFPRRVVGSFANALARRQEQARQKAAGFWRGRCPKSHADAVARFYALR